MEVTYRSSFFFIHGELLLLDSLQLVPKVELRSLLLELRKLVLVFWNFLQCRFDAKEEIGKFNIKFNKYYPLIERVLSKFIFGYLQFSSQIVNSNVQLIDLWKNIIRNEWINFTWYIDTTLYGKIWKLIWRSITLRMAKG